MARSRRWPRVGDRPIRRCSISLIDGSQLGRDRRCLNSWSPGSCAAIRLRARRARGSRGHGRSRLQQRRDRLPDHRLQAGFTDRCPSATMSPPGPTARDVLRRSRRFQCPPSDGPSSPRPSRSSTPRSTRSNSPSGTASEACFDAAAPFGGRLGVGLLRGSAPRTTAEAVPPQRRIRRGSTTTSWSSSRTRSSRRRARRRGGEEAARGRRPGARRRPASTTSELARPSRS